MLRLDTRLRMVLRVWFTPDGKSVVAQAPENKYLRWALFEPRKRDEIIGPGYLNSFAVSADLSMMAETVFERFRVRAVVLRRGAEPVRRIDDISRRQFVMSFTPDNSRLSAR